LYSQEGEILVTMKKLLNRIQLYQFSHSSVADSKIGQELQCFALNFF
jgi:hypothetical protein